MYNHLSLKERELLAIWQGQQVSQREIAKRLGRNQSSLSRELKRNITGVGARSHELFNAQYLPCMAQKKAGRRAFKQRAKAPLKNTKILTFVLKHLTQDCWSPQTISAMLTIKYPFESITKETIYQYIYKRQFKTKGIFAIPQKPLSSYLPLARKKRMKLNGRRVQRHGKIPGSISIERRPKYINKRVQLGHWETDNVIGKVTDKTALSVSVERVTRYTVLSLTNRSARQKADYLTQRLLTLPQKARRTITTDNGKENYYHSQISTNLNILMYFCHTYASWEKGTVENMNGRIRRYIPKGTSLDPVTTDQIQALEDKLNSTPRKCLNYLTPQEKLNILLTAH
jgi:IS30 family transposase